jgi:hypothetical protein
MLGSVVFAVSKDTSTTGPMTWETLPVLCDILEELIFNGHISPIILSANIVENICFIELYGQKKRAQLGSFLIINLFTL